MSRAVDQPAHLGERVVGAGQDAREVQRQDAVALVATEQLGRLRGAEQHDQDADEAVVRVVADRRCLLDRVTARSGLRGQRREPDREDRRQDGQPGEGERRDLGATAATDPEAGPEALRVERDDGAAPAEPRALVRLVAEVVDAAAGAARRGRVGRGRSERGAAHLTPATARHAAAGAAVRRTVVPRRSPTGRPDRRRVAEQVLEALPPLLEPDEREPQLRDGVADDVERLVVGDRDEDRPAVGHGLEAAGDERPGQGGLALLDLDGQDAGPLGERPERRGPEQPPGIDGDEEVAHPLDLAEQVAGDDDGDAELGAGPPDERRASRRARPGRARWSARRAAAGAGRGRAPGRA